MRDILLVNVHEIIAPVWGLSHFSFFFAFIPQALLFNNFYPRALLSYMVEGMLTGPDKHVFVLHVLQSYVSLASCTYTSSLLYHPAHINIININRTFAVRGVHGFVCVNEQVLRPEGQ